MLVIIKLLYIEQSEVNLAPIDIMFLIDASNSIGNRSFEKVKKKIIIFF